MEPTIKPDAATDPEWAELQKRTPGLMDDDVPPVEKKEEEPVKEPTPPPAEKPKEEPKVEKEEEEVDPPPTIKRPERYIPVEQHRDQLSRKDKTIADKDHRIAELEAIVGQKEGSLKEEKAVEAYAEKHGLDIDVAKEQVEDLREVLGIKHEEKKEEKKTDRLSPEEQALIERAKEVEGKDLFNKEFTSSAIPTLKELFPKATLEQIESAKKIIETIACTDQFLDKTLDFVVFKSQKELSEVFKTKTAGPETQRQTPSKTNTEYTSDDFNSGKISLSELDNLTPEKRNKVIEDMTPSTYEKWCRLNDKNDQLIINRGGKQIRF